MKAKSSYLFFLLFALSGFSGLIYESIWTHYLKLFLGHAAYAQTLVLAIFMGGMAIGSWFCSWRSYRWANLLLGYAAAEAVIGVFAMVFHETFIAVIESCYTTIIPKLGLPWAVIACKWGVSALLILPQSILLGMTFPLMSAGILRLWPEKPGRTIGILYFTNSLGAAAGVLVSGFWLIRMLGLPGTIRTAGAINLALALIVWAMARNDKASAEVIAPTSSDRGGMAEIPWHRLLLAASLITGIASFIYEIAWIRMLSLVLGTSTHAFELMLSAFILGLAFGGLWIQRRIDRLASPILTLGRVQFAMGMLALATLLLYGQTFEVMQWLMQNLEKTNQGYTLFNLASSAIAMAVMLPVTFCAGMTLPLITTILFRHGGGEKSIGEVYAANTVGAIAGVFFAIHLGLPLLGIKGLMTLGASFDMLLGLVLLWRCAEQEGKRQAAIYATVTGVATVVAILMLVRLDIYKMGSGVYRRGELNSSENTRLSITRMVRLPPSASSI